MTAISLPDLLNRLESVKATGSDKWQACCPAHDDNEASLSVGVGESGKILLKCFAGCDLNAILQPLHLTSADLFPPPERKSGLGRIVTTYDYTDERGKLLYQVVRYDPKDFRQRRPDGAGGYHWNLTDVPRVLYRLPEVQAAVQRKETILLAEGEKDCDALIALGLMATTNAQGADQPFLPAYCDVLRGARVVILPDNDTAGRKCHDRRSQALQGIADDIRMLELPGLPDKGDVSDWLGQGGTKAELLRLIENAPQSKPLLSGANRSSEESADAPPAWEAVVPFGTNALPPFPLDALPSWLRAFAEAVTEQCETPPDLAGVLVLSVVAAAIAGKAQVCPSPGWFEPLNLFCIVALPPASRKSAVFKLVTKPLHEYERAENERLKPEIAQKESERRILKARLDAAEASAAKSKTQDSRNESEAQAQHLAEEFAALKVPGLLRLFTDDCTLERLAGLMSEQQGRMAVLSAEGGLFGTLAGRYNEKGTNIDAVLKGHAGDALRVDRVGRPPEYVDNPTLTLGLAVQPNVLEGLASVPTFRGRGLLARFLYSLPASNIGFRANNNPPIPPLVTAAYAAGMERLLRMEVPTDQDDEPQPLTLLLEPNASTQFRAFRCAIEDDMQPGNGLHDIDDWAGKMAGAVARLAGVLHMAEHGDTCRSVSSATLAPAIALGKYFMQHALAAFDKMGADPEIEDARHVLKWIMRTRPAQFTQREAHNALQGRFQRAEPLQRALAILTERHYLRTTQAEAKSGAGRKPGAIYEVNPALQNI